MRIKSATISAMPKSFSDPMPKVTAIMEDDSIRELFTYFPDEISFSPSEFVGLTVDEALALYHKKDVAYLRS